MKISVVIPCHNAEQWIERSIRSVINQTRKPDEIVVVLDNCTDGSKKVVEEFANDCVIIEAQCGSGGLARNIGIKHATGEWIAFNDADDFWYPRHLESFEKLVAGTNAVAYMGLFDYFYWQSPDQIRRHDISWLVKEPAVLDTPEKSVEFIARLRLFAMPSCIIRKQILDEVGAFDEYLWASEDIHMFYKVVSKGPFVYNPEPMGAYQIDSPGSITRKTFNVCRFFFEGMLDIKQKYYPDNVWLAKAVSRGAYITCNTAWMEGDSERIKEAMRIAYKYLWLRYKILFGLTRYCTWLYRCPNNIRRKLKYKRAARTAES